jgi:hypothetical protein
MLFWQPGPQNHRRFLARQPICFAGSLEQFPALAFIFARASQRIPAPSGLGSEFRFMFFNTFEKIFK